ncbi:MAG: hypothetical protein H0W70_03385 [Actinobacteria bacterium]|nr:hypothetical protein [Actinomycetota bacterium]
MRRLPAIVAAVVTALAITTALAPAGSAAEIAGYGMSALAVGVRYQLNSPGFLPVGDPAEGTVMEYDVPIARTGISQGPVINAIASPLYPGDTAAHLGTAVATFNPKAPLIPNYPVVAEANYPPTPDKGATASFGQGGVGEGRAETGPDGAKVVAQTAAQSVESVVAIGASVTRNDLSISAGRIRSLATSATSGITIAGMITIEGVIGTAEAISDGSKGTPSARLEIGKVTAAGQAAYIDRDGVHIAANPVLGAGVVTGIQQMVNGVLNTDGIRIRTIAPSTKVDGAAATAVAGALAITLDRMVPATGVPGQPALEIPNGPTVILGTPDLPTHTDILIGEARAGVNATSVTLDLDVLPAVTSALDGGGEVTSDGLGPISGAGATLEGALTGPALSQAGKAALKFRPSAETGRGLGVPTGWVIFGLFATLAFAGPLLGYARWQLLEGRQR